MINTQLYLTNFCYSFIAFGLFFSAIRTVKFRRMLALRYLNINDFNFMVIISLLVTILANTHFLYLSLPVFIVLVVGMFFLTIDAIISMEYGYQLDWQTLKLAWQQRDAMVATGDGNAFLLSYVVAQKHLLLLPLSFSIYSFGLLTNNQNILWYFFPMYFGVACIVLTKSKLNKQTFIPWLLVIVTLYICQQHVNNKFPIDSVYQLYAGIAVFSLLLIGNMAKWFSEWPFFQIPSVIAQLYSKDMVDRRVDFCPTEQDHKIIQLDLQATINSEQHGKLANANVILIYLESVNAYSIKNSVTQQANLPFFESLVKTGWQSGYHISMTPNTNGSLRALFSSQYALASEYHYIELLKAHGYETVFLAATDLHGGTKELAEEIGFDEILYFRDSSPAHTQDIDFYQHKLPKLKEKLAKQDKFFLMIHNQQTHLPYAVYNETPKQNNYLRYQQAMLESDQAIEQLIQQLGLPMDNTLIIYTSDHGQSFGQFGFTAHSNSVVKEQINVPFVLAHPKLSPRNISHSSHFDVMPTVMDLLGINYPYPIAGKSMANLNLPFSHILFSETRNGKFPSCFAHINSERKLFFDLNYHRFLWLTLEDEIIAPLSKQELVHYKQVMLRALEVRELIDRPYS